MASRSWTSRLTRKPRRIELPKLGPGKTPVLEGGNASHGMAVSADGKRLVVDSRLNSAIYVYSLPELEPRGLSRCWYSARLGDAHARRQDCLRRERGLEFRIGRRSDRSEGGNANSCRPGPEEEHHGRCCRKWPPGEGQIKQTCDPIDIGGGYDSSAEACVRDPASEHSNAATSHVCQDRAPRRSISSRPVRQVARTHWRA